MRVLTEEELDSLLQRREKINKQIKRGRESING